MADTSSATAWFALAGALGGVLLTGTIGLVTAALNQRWNERTRVQSVADTDARAMRDQLRAVCHAYLVAANGFYHVLDQVRGMASRREQFDAAEHTRLAETGLQDAYMYLTISAGSRVRELARAYNESQYELEGVARRGDRSAWVEQARIVRRLRDELRAAMREELGVRD